MQHEIYMPYLSKSIDEGVVATWFVDVGATVRKDQLLAEVQVEKTAVDVLSPVDGRVKEIRVGPQGIARQGEVVAVIEEAK
jgi:pyruvate/2-oxoglutarate dehydrogenase complex dihydrolipoamide acyltransferase (E2) component